MDENSFFSQASQFEDSSYLPEFNDFFERNKYLFWYAALIAKARGRIHNEGTYTEAHHIIPRSLKGSDLPTNLVRLTAKEHFVAHHLLTRMCKEKRHRDSMWNAFFLMHWHSTEKRFVRSRTYELARLRMAETKRSLVGSANHFYGKKHSAETKAKMSQKRVGRVCRKCTIVFSFHHPDHGVIRCTQQELYKEFSLCKKGINSIVRGKAISHKGWRIHSNERNI